MNTPATMPDPASEGTPDAFAWTKGLVLTLVNELTRGVNQGTHTLDTRGMMQNGPAVKVITQEGTTHAIDPVYGAMIVGLWTERHGKL